MVTEFVFSNKCLFLNVYHKQTYQNERLERQETGLSTSQLKNYIEVKTDQHQLSRLAS